MARGSYLSIITLNVNGLNAPTKRQRLAEWIQKQDPYICCLHLKTGDTYRLKVKGWKKIFHANRDQNKKFECPLAPSHMSKNLFCRYACICLQRPYKDIHHSIVCDCSRLEMTEIFLIRGLVNKWWS